MKCPIRNNIHSHISRSAGKVTVLLLAGILVLSCCSTGEAKSPVVSAITDTTQIRIGEQFHLDLMAVMEPGTRISFPQFTDTFNHFEVVNRGTIDTVSNKEAKELTLRQQLTLTSFDSGYFVIPPFYFTGPGTQNATDTFATEALLMTVRTVPVDTTKEIKAIKNIIDVPFPWQDYILYALGVLVLAAGIYFLVRRLRKKLPVADQPVVPDRPAHEIALEGLKRIESEKLWQQGFTKKYYSELTDVLRQYIERRFLFNAMEQTTDEILRHFHAATIRDEEKKKLTFILRQADMVKFAKAQPLPPENEGSMSYAYDFVNVTRPVIPSDLEKKEEVK